LFEENDLYRAYYRGRPVIGKDGDLNEVTRFSGLQGLHRELQWDGENMIFTNISPTDTIKIVAVVEYSVTNGHPTFDRQYVEFNALKMADEWIKHT